MATFESTPCNFVSGADLTGKLGYFGKIDSSGRVVVCSVAGEAAHLIIASEPNAAGKGADGWTERQPKVRAGGSFDAGARLTTTAAGKAVVATAGDTVNAIALQAGVDGRMVEVMRPLALGVTGDGGYQAISASGAISPSAGRVDVSIDATKAYTLADGNVGHEIDLLVVAGTNTPRGTLTIATPFTGESATHVLHAVGQRLRLRMTAAGWKVTDKKRVGDLTVVVGTTVLTGYDMAARYNLSVTGAVASTGAQGIPAGQVPGELIDVQATVNTGGTDEGEIAITAVDLDNAAFTKIDAINGTTAHHAQFRWEGVAWQTVVAPTGVVLA